MTVAWRNYPLAATCAAIFALGSVAPAQASKERFVVDLVNVCTAVRKPSSGAPAFVPARAA